ncbi:hypothetical protein GQ457_02G026480 [Hibiscus cannabinus]
MLGMCDDAHALHMLPRVHGACSRSHHMPSTCIDEGSFQLKEAGTPSASSFQLIEAPFSSTLALLAQLKLNNPEVAETHPVQERVSYEHVDSKRGVLHLSMHMHNMCGSLGMLWACGRDLGTSQACGWLNQPLSLHLFPPKWNSLTTVLDP